MKTGTSPLRRILGWSILAVVVAVCFVPLTMKSRGSAEAKASESNMTYNKLTPEEERVIVNKGTELPFTGKYDNFTAAGTYTCKRCGAVLFRSSDKFDAGCGWPAFDDAVPGAVTRTTDADGLATEITCTNCGAHLGHVFEGELFTAKNQRYCVNSISMNFTPAGEVVTSTAGGTSSAPKVTTEKAYFAGGCFWGTEYFLQQAPGVISARVGYMGGHTDHPTYGEVCDHGTGHAETVEVIFDPAKTTYEALARYFFEIHDPTELDRQGPDVGDQYRSAVFYVDDAQKQTAEKLIDILKGKGYKVVTEVTKAGTFWEGEKYHQDYYRNNGHTPYCHIYTKRF